MDSQGQTVQECVEKAIEDSTDHLTKLEKRGRVASVVDSSTLHTLEPASMIRQVTLSTVSNSFFLGAPRFTN